MKHNYQIGDWVYDSKRSQYPMQVVAVFRERNGAICDLDLDFEGNEGGVWECKADEVEPIPITAEILEKSGFVNDGSRWYKLDGDNFTVICNPYYTVIKIVGNDCVLRGKAEYIHQLQQGLRLCGIDKEIKL